MMITSLCAVPYGAREHFICIDSYDNGAITGRIYTAFCAEALHFGSLLEMSRLVDTILDQAGVQAAEVHRSFSKKVPERPAFAEPKQDWHRQSCAKGRIATFSLLVQFRQHASWQGHVSWMEAKKTQNFRSALELFQLMDSALGEAVMPSAAEG